MAGVDSSVPVTRAVLEQAKRNLDSVDVIGVLDNVGDYFADLACVLRPSLARGPLPPGVTPYHSHTIRDNQSRRPTAMLTKKFKEAVYRGSWADLELVAYARARAHQQRQRLAKQCPL